MFLAGQLATPGSLSQRTVRTKRRSCVCPWATLREEPVAPTASAGGGLHDNSRVGCAGGWGHPAHHRPVTSSTTRPTEDGGQYGGPWSDPCLTASSSYSTRVVGEEWDWMAF